MRWCGVVTVLISATLISISLGCIDHKDISGNNIIGNDNNLKTIAKMMPNHKQGEIIYFNLNAMRKDDYLKDYLSEIVSNPKGSEGINGDSIDYIAMEMGINSVILVGSFDTNQVIKTLNEKSIRNNYLGVDFWVGDKKETTPTVIIDDKLIAANFPNDIAVPKAWIEVSKGINKSLYEGNEDVRDVVERLPDGVVIMIANPPWVKDVVKMGTSIFEGDKETLNVKGIYKFNDENSSAKLKYYIARNPSAMWNMTVIDTKQDGKFIELTAKMPMKELFKPSHPKTEPAPMPPIIINSTEVRKNRLVGLKFYDNLEQAQEVARKENKFIFLYMTSENSRWSEYFEGEILTNKSVVVKLNEKFISVYIDVDKQKDMPKKFKVRGTPTSIFLDSNGVEVGRITGIQDVETFLMVISNYK